MRVLMNLKFEALMMVPVDLYRVAEVRLLFLPWLYYPICGHRRGQG